MTEESKVDVEKILRNRLALDQEVISAMQRRIAKNPIRNFFWRKPWKASLKGRRGDTLWVTIQNYWQFLSLAHDCKDPSVGCSCTDGYRFPGKD